MPKFETKGLHIKFLNPIDNRKEILESALLTANLLQKYEDFKSIRNEKTKQKALLKKTIKEIRLLFKDLEYKELPEYKIPKTQKKPKETKPDLKETITKTKLESELESIRKKLENLKI